MIERLPHGRGPLSRLNRTIDAVEQMRRAEMSGGDFSQSFGLAAGIVDGRIDRIRLQIMGGTNPYAWTQVVQSSPSKATWIDPVMYFGTEGSFPAIELNGRADVPVGAIVDGVIDKLYGKVLFEYSSETDEEESQQLPIPMRLDSRSGFTYGWVEQEQLANGTYEDKYQGMSGTTGSHGAYEVNERTDVPINTTVFGFPGRGWNPRTEIAVTQEGNGTVKEIQSLAIVDAASGNFTLAYSQNVTPLAYQTTGALAFDANATVIETALEGLSNISNVTITGNGTQSDPFLIQFEDSTDNQPMLIANDTGLVGARLWGFEYAPPSSSNSTIIPELTVTTSLLSETLTTLNGALTINANVTQAANTTVLFSGVQAHTWSGAYTANYYGGAASFTFGSAVAQTYNSTLAATFNGNVTYSFVGAILFTICGNTTICANKTLTLPNNVALPGFTPLRMLGASNAGTPLMQAVSVGPNLTLGVSNGTMTLDAIAATGNGTSAGGNGDIQFADGVGGFLNEDGGPTYVLQYNKTTHQMRLYALRVDGLTQGLTYIDNAANMTTAAVGSNRSLPYSDGTHLVFESGGPTYVFEYDGNAHQLRAYNLRIDSMSVGPKSVAIFDNSPNMTADSTGGLLGYSVATSGDWNSVPSNVKAALDELASRVKTLEGP